VNAEPKHLFLEKIKSHFSVSSTTLTLYSFSYSITRFSLSILPLFTPTLLVKKGIYLNGGNYQRQRLKFSY